MQWSYVHLSHVTSWCAQQITGTGYSVVTSEGTLEFIDLVLDCLLSIRRLSIP